MRAVFLSYASQDAAAARRICEALRSGGVEVWFDADGGLEHGDEWDAKIRRQIKECVLFIPVISASTQEREEGYFRLEWDLAAERARTIASGVPFILPVVIDDTREPEALVPDRFRAVQWTRLRGGEVPPEVQQRFLKLWSHRTGLLKSKPHAVDSPPGSQSPVSGSTAAPEARRRRLIGIGATVVAISLGVFLAKRLSSPPAASPASAESSSPSQLPAPGPRYTASRPEVAALLVRARSMTDKSDVARAELETALSLLDQAAKLDPADANVWAERALVELLYVTTVLDNTPGCVDAARQHAKQATSLDPKNPHARLADALTQIQVATDQASANAAAAILESLVAEGTDRPDAYFALASLKFRKRQADEAFALLDQAARLPGAAGRAATEKAIKYISLKEWAKADATLDQALALERSARALLWKSYVATVWLGDAALAKQAIAGIPPGMLTEDFPASGKLFVALWAHDFNLAIATMRAVPRDYISSGALSGPTGYYVGYALARTGRKAAAEIEWRSALEVVNRRFEANPRNGVLFTMKALLLAALGDRAGAEKTLQTLRELYPSAWTGTWEGRMLALQLLPPEEAIALLAKNSRDIMAAGLSGSLKLDPFADDLRSHPKFIELLAAVEANPKLSPHATPQPAAGFDASLPPAEGREPAIGVPAGKLDEKSVAVLAFENLSTEKENEYFAEGISDELLNELGKVPGLRVAGRLSAFSFRGKNVPDAEIARQLGVSYLVNGSVQKSGSQVRVTARLNRAADGVQLWSDHFTKELRDVFALQDEIAAVIAQNLQLTLGAAPRAHAAVNSDALRLAIEGRHFWTLRSPEGFARAELAYTQALRLDPQFAEAHAGLADVCAVRGWYASLAGQSVEEDFTRARAEAQRALELDAALAQPHATLGVVNYNEQKFAEAEGEFQTALRLNPNYAYGHHWHAHLLAERGHLEESLAEMDVAARLDPLSVVTLVIQAVHLEYAGRYVEAAAVCARAAVLGQEVFVPLENTRSLALWQIGRHDEAIAAARNAVRDTTLSPRWWTDAYGLYVLREAGLTDEARASGDRLLAEMEPGNRTRAAVFMGLGRTTDAIEHLVRTRPGASTFGSIFYSIVWADARADPRFAAAIEHLGCTEDYRAAMTSLARLQAPKR